VAKLKHVGKNKIKRKEKEKERKKMQVCKWLMYELYNS